MSLTRSFCVAFTIFCCLILAAAWSLAFTGQRSSQWHKVRTAHLAAEPWCALCGTEDDLEVHHLVPFHVAPELELAETNLCTLCRHCHLEAGHLGNFTNSFPELRAEIGDVGLRLHDRRPARRVQP